MALPFFFAIFSWIQISLITGLLHQLKKCEETLTGHSYVGFQKLVPTGCFSLQYFLT